MHDFIVKRAVNFVPDLLLHSLRAPAKNARHFYSCFQACILPPNFLTGSLRTGKLHRWSRSGHRPRPTGGDGDGPLAGGRTPVECRAHCASSKGRHMQ